MTAVNIAGIEEDERALVVRIAQEWAGTPYHHRARIKGVGVDCGQLVAGVFEEAGLIPPGMRISRCAVAQFTKADIISR